MEKFTSDVLKKPSKRFENGNGYKKCTRFWNAICEDGFDAFEHIILHSGLTKDAAHEFEEKLVDAYDAMNPEHGYNMRRGGYHNTPCPEVGKHISQAKLGHEVSPETREKIRRCFYNTGHAKKKYYRNL